MSFKLDEFEKKIISIESNLKNALKEINEIKKEFAIYNKTIIVESKKDNRKSFAEYLKDIKLLKDKSIESYIGALNQIKLLIYNELGIKIDCELYEINDISIFKKIIELFENSAELIEINLKRHHFYSATYHNYLSFLEYEALVNE